jgi:hypothetical protein|tara:strand:- start:5175 stop:5711 length:537 start_codon:yes stop_codon:yes gene_type:complete
MAVSNFNIASLRARRFKGFLQFQDPENVTDYLRLKERQNLTVSFQWNKAEHYSDDGTKVFDPNGYNHSFNITMKTSSDLFGTDYSGIDLTDASTYDGKTLSYWIKKSQNYENVEIVFVATIEAEGSNSDKFIHIKFTGEIEAITPITLPTGGATSETTISGQIKEITEVKKTTTQLPP